MRGSADGAPRHGPSPSSLPQVLALRARGSRALVITARQRQAWFGSRTPQYTLQRPERLPSRGSSTGLTWGLACVWAVDAHRHTNPSAHSPPRYRVTRLTLHTPFLRFRHSLSSSPPHMAAARRPGPAPRQRQCACRLLFPVLRCAHHFFSLPQPRRHQCDPPSIAGPPEAGRTRCGRRTPCVHDHTQASEATRGAFTPDSRTRPQIWNCNKMAVTGT
jgi:hypothetical protein